MSVSGIKLSSCPTREVGRLDGHEGAVMAVRFNRDGGYCLTCGKDRLVKLWNPHSALEIKAYKGHGFEVTDVDTSPDNGRIVSCSVDKSIIIWDVGTGQSIRKIRAHNSAINTVRFNEDSTLAVSAGYDSSVKLWDLRASSYDPLQILDDARDSVTSIDVSNHEIATASVDGYVRCYDIRAGKLRTDFMDDPVTCVRFSHDGNCMLVSALDNTVRLMDKTTGEMLCSYTGHKNEEFKIDNCFSYNDAIVASGSEDGSVWMWDLVQGKKLSAAKAHTKSVCSMSYHPKEATLLTASVDGSVIVWKSPALVNPEEAEKEDDDDIPQPSADIGPQPRPQQN